MITITHVMVVTTTGWGECPPEEVCSLCHGCQPPAQLPPLRSKAMSKCWSGASSFMAGGPSPPGY